MIENLQKYQPIGYKILKKLQVTRNFAHAYLIETNGYDGGYDFAVFLAKIILCKNSEDILISKMIDDNNYPELKIINSEGNWIKKEELLDLQEEFSTKSLSGNNKVYIINGVEKLNVSSSNAILKFLEEPQKGIIAILVTENIYQLLETIISRCQIISLNGQVSINNKITTLEKVSDLLSNTKKTYEEYLNDESTKLLLDAIIKFVKHLEHFKNKAIIYTTDNWFNYFNDKEKMYNALLLVIYFYKDLLNYKIGIDLEIFNDYLTVIEELAKNNTVEEIIKKINIINLNRNYLNNNANLNLLLDKIIIEVSND